MQNTLRQQPPGRLAVRLTFEQVMQFRDRHDFRMRGQESYSESCFRTAKSR